jgi:DnaJ domain
MVETAPLFWPEGWPRTAAHAQERGYQFKQKNSTNSYGATTMVTFSTARDKLYDELQRLGASSPVVSTNHPTGRYGIPTESKRRLQDEGVAVYFTFKARPMVMACDRFDNAAANMRSLGLAIEAMRQLERHGGGTMIERAFTGFLALPAPKSPYETLGLHPGASDEEVEKAFRQKAKELHSDVNHGSPDKAMADLNEARRKLKEQAA